jgi:hypothetical protein
MPSSRGAGADGCVAGAVARAVGRPRDGYQGCASLHPASCPGTLLANAAAERNTAHQNSIPMQGPGCRMPCDGSRPRQPGRSALPSAPSPPPSPPSTPTQPPLTRAAPRCRPSCQHSSQPRSQPRGPAWPRPRPSSAPPVPPTARAAPGHTSPPSPPAATAPTPPAPPRPTASSRPASGPRRRARAPCPRAALSRALAWWAWAAMAPTAARPAARRWRLGWRRSRWPLVRRGGLYSQQ